MTIEHIRDAANLTQSVVHRINQNLVSETGQTLQSFVQKNNFSGLVSNILTDSIDRCSPYEHNGDSQYPDLICPVGEAKLPIGLEVKVTATYGKGGEGHNGHSGWHLIACYKFLESGDIEFVHIMLADINGHQSTSPDWQYVKSKVNPKTGSQRTETYTTNLKGTTKLRDGSVYLNHREISYRRWRQERDGDVPPWSIFAL